MRSCSPWLPAVTEVLAAPQPQRLSTHKPRTAGLQGRTAEPSTHLSRSASLQNAGRGAAPPQRPCVVPPHPSFTPSGGLRRHQRRKVPVLGARGVSVESPGQGRQLLPGVLAHRAGAAGQQGRRVRLQSRLEHGLHSTAGGARARGQLLPGGGMYMWPCAPCQRTRGSRHRPIAAGEGDTVGERGPGCHVSEERASAATSHPPCRQAHQVLPPAAPAASLPLPPRPLTASGRRPEHCAAQPGLLRQRAPRAGARPRG